MFAMHMDTVLIPMGLLKLKENVTLYNGCNLHISGFLHLITTPLNLLENKIVISTNEIKTKSWRGSTNYNLKMKTWKSSSAVHLVEDVPGVGWHLWISCDSRN